MSCLTDWPATPHFYLPIKFVLLNHAILPPRRASVVVTLTEDLILIISSTSWPLATYQGSHHQTQVGAYLPPSVPYLSVSYFCSGLSLSCGMPCPLLFEVLLMSYATWQLREADFLTQPLSQPSFFFDKWHFPLSKDWSLLSLVSHSKLSVFGLEFELWVHCSTNLKQFSHKQWVRTFSAN